MRRHLFLAVLLAWAGCEGDPNDPQTWIKKLHDVHLSSSGKTTVQKEAIQNLVRIDNKAAVPALIDLYKDPKGSHDPDVLDAIIHFHDPQSIPLLIEALEYTEQDFDAAAKAAAELGNLKVQQAVPKLIQTLDKPLNIKARANLVKWEAIRALAKIKDASAVEPLCKVVKALPSEQDMFLNKVAALALGELSDARGVPCLLYGAFITRGDGATFFPEVRVSISRIGEPAVDPTIALLSDKNAEVQALGKKLEFKPGVTAFKAAILLGDLRAKKAVPALVAKLKAPIKGDEMEREMQGEILRALGKIGDPAGVDAVLATLKDGKQKSEVRQGACQGALAARDMRALPILLGLAKDKKTEASLRAKAAIVLGLLGGKAEYAAFAPVAKAEDYTEFSTAASQLEVASKCAGDLDDCWARALDSKDIVAQIKGAAMLGAAKDHAKSVKALVAHLDNPDPQVRETMLDSLRRVADKGCSDCQAKLKELISREEKLTTKLPQFKRIVDEMNVTLAALARGS